MYINTINHIHGFTDSRMILGVNDVSQINNELLKNEKYVKEAMIKNEYNMVIGNLIMNKCYTILNNSKLICIFGMSIGDTDKFWWQTIGKLIAENDKMLIIFSKGNEIPPIHEHKRNREEEAVIEYFINQANLSKELDLSNKIIVGYNTKILNNNTP